MKISTTIFALTFASLGVSTAGISNAQAREQLQIVGSSTVFPFATTVAERFGQTSDFPTPIIESTGSGGGLKLFCAGVGVNTPDIANASRRIKNSELETCAQNGATPVEVRIGFDGIVLANSKSGPEFSLSRQQIFLALARNIVVEGELVPNPFSRWSEIDPSLPDVTIEVLGPPPTSGTRDAFVELVMHQACQPGIEESKCGDIREDGVYIDAGENDNLIVQKLAANSAAIGIFGFSFLDQNADTLHGAVVDGTDPTFENIADATYPIARSLYFYLKKQHVGTIPGLVEYALAFTSDRAVGEDGYLSEKGLIPLADDQRQAVIEDINELKPAQKN